MKFWKTPWVGIDIGTRTIKGIKLKQKGHQVFLERYFLHDLSKTSEDFPQSSNLEETLKADIEINRLARLPAAVNIRDEDVFNLSFTLPKMPYEEVRVAVGHEIQESLNIPITELSYDYLIANEGSLDESEQLNVKAYCAKQDVVTGRVALITKALMMAAAAESDMLAIFEMLKFNDYIDPARDQVVFDLGESHLGIGLITAGQLSMVKTSKIALGNINQALTEQLKLSYSAGEDLKLKHDLGQADSLDSSDQGESSEAKAAVIIDQIYFEIFKEAKECVDFLREGHGVKIDRVLLAGGGSQIVNISQVFEHYFKTPVMIVNPLKNINIFGKEPGQDAEIAKAGPHLATAVGLALRDIA